MLQGKKAYICSPLSAPNPEGVQHNMELAKYYLMQMKRLYHCRTFASHAHLPLMLDDRIPEERETAMQIAVLMLDLCEVLIICGSHISEGMRSEIQTAFVKGKDIYWYDSKTSRGRLPLCSLVRCTLLSCKWRLLPLFPDDSQSCHPKTAAHRLA